MEVWASNEGCSDDSEEEAYVMLIGVKKGGYYSNHGVMRAGYYGYSDQGVKKAGYHSNQEDARQDAGYRITG